MSQEWMIDVLTDLTRFARQNGLMGLAEQLDDTILVAAAELKSMDLDASEIDTPSEQNSGVSGTLAAGDNL